MERLRFIVFIARPPPRINRDLFPGALRSGFVAEWLKAGNL
jgi:hypothetical protein